MSNWEWCGINLYRCPKCMLYTDEKGFHDGRSCFCEGLTKASWPTKEEWKRQMEGTPYIYSPDTGAWTLNPSRTSEPIRQPEPEYDEAAVLKAHILHHRPDYS